MAINETIEKIIFEGIDRISAPSKKAQGSVKDLRTAVDTVKDALAAIGVTVGAGAFVKLTMDTIKAQAALDDMSEATGASVETLSAIRNVAKVSGADFEGLTSQVGKLIKGLHTGSDESNRTAAALRYLGVSAVDANGHFRDTGQVIIDVAKALDQYEDDGKKVLLIQDALGRGAERYAPLLKDIAAGTDLVVKVTRDQAAAAEEAEKNINRLKVIFEDANRELTNGLVPTIIRLTDAMIAANQAGGNFFDKMRLFLAGASVEDPLAQIGVVEERLAHLQRLKEALTSDNTITGWLNNKLNPEDKVILNQQIEEAEKEKKFLQELNARRVRGNAQGMVEDAAGFHPSPAKARGTYTPPETSGSSKRLSPEEVAKRQIEEEERLGKEMREAIDARVKYGIQKQEEWLNTLQEGARARQRMEEEQEARATEAMKRTQELAAAEIARIGQTVILEEEADQRLIEIENARHQRMLDNIALQMTTREETDAMAEAAEYEHQERLLQIEDEITRRKFNIQKVHRKLDMDSAKTFFGHMSALMNTNSRKMFEIGKAAAIAETIINTYSAAMGAYKALASIPYVGPALGAAAAAAAIASGMAQVQAIRSQSFGGGGGGGGAAGAFAANPTTGLPVGTPGGNVGEGTARQTATIVLHGDTYSRKSVRDMFDALNEDMDDGGRFFVVEGQR